MKKRKNIFLGGLLAGLALVLTSCLFDSDANGVESWLSDHGMPSTYKVQKLDIGGIRVASAEVGFDSAPILASSIAVLGNYSKVSHDVVFEFAFAPSADFKSVFKAADSAQSYLILYWNRNVYSDKNYKDIYATGEFPQDSLPNDSDVKLSFSWKIDVIHGNKALKNIQSISDSTWLHSLDWDSAPSADTTLDIVYTRDAATVDRDTVFPYVRIDMPSAFVDSLNALDTGTVYLQLRVSAPEAKHVYRFFGSSQAYVPTFYMDAKKDSTGKNRYISAPSLRAATVQKSNEDCPECLVIHGGVRDSLVVEVPSEPIMKALSEFYGDEFPFTEGDKNDVRQSVVLAELTMARDDSQGSHELGRPIQVVFGSYVDSANTSVCRMESYRLNNQVISSEGHQNLVFHDGDSLTIQLTLGAKNLLNKAADGHPLKFVMYMGFPFLQEKDTTYATYKTDDGDTVYLRLGYYDYARYDFSTSFEKPVSLKLWMATKRGDE